MSAEQGPPRRRATAGLLRPGLGVGLWLVATSVAMLAIWIGVSVATRSVIGAPLPTLGSDDVAALAAEPSSTTTSTTPTTSTTSPAPSTTTLTPGAGGAVISTTSPRAVASTLAPASTTTTLPPSGGAAHPLTGTFSNAGGEVTVSCLRADVSLVSAIPTNGYAVSVPESGPRRVIVVFTAASGPVPIAAVCREGRPTLTKAPPPAQPAPPPPTDPSAPPPTS